MKRKLYFNHSEADGSFIGEGGAQARYRYRYVRRHLGSFWFQRGPEAPRLKQVSKLFPDSVKPLLQMYWTVEPALK